MSIENSEYWTLISRYLADELSSEEEARLNKWLNESTEKTKSFEQAKILWELAKTAKKKEDFDTDAEWKELRKKLLIESEEKKRPSKKVVFKIGFGIAASIIILFGINYLLNPEAEKNQNNTPLAATIEVVTPADSTISFYLPDSSYVLLNENSRISYPETFARDLRFVQLSGEAYFEVQAASDKPFKIAATDAQVTVIGTSFNVKAYDDDEAVDVEVFEGEVEFSSNKKQDEGIRIKKGEKGSYSKSSKGVTKQKSSGKYPKWVRDIKYNTKDIFNKIKNKFKNL
ncbi:FecR domain-containing protein [Crocinitomix catalasitica]|nr:FecR domain-containing protein [Crocinitomix catalasitica]